LMKAKTEVWPTPHLSQHEPSVHPGCRRASTSRNQRTFRRDDESVAARLSRRIEVCIVSAGSSDADLLQVVEQRLGVLEVLCIETLGEPAIDRR
jgi:hypothetical protein